jgi:hypothetical protein
MSDWSAQESGVASALAGLDMTMPGDVNFGDGISYWGGEWIRETMNIGGNSLKLPRQPYSGGSKRHGSAMETRRHGGSHHGSVLQGWP